MPRLILPQCKSSYTHLISAGASAAVSELACLALGGDADGRSEDWRARPVAADTTGTTAKLSRLRHTHTMHRA